MRRQARLAVVLAALSAPAAAQPSAPAPCGDGACSPAEQWVTGTVFAGHEADLDMFVQQHPGAGKTLRPSFLRALLLSGSEKPLVVAQGITIQNADICEAEAADPGQDYCLALPLRSVAARHGDAWAGPFAAPLDLRDIRFGGALEIRRSNFHADVRLGGAYFEQVLDLDESLFEGDIDAYRLRADGGVTMVDAYVAGNLEADGLRTGGTANFFATRIAGAIHLRGAHIGNDLDFGRIAVNGPFRLKADPVPRSSVELPRSAVDISNAWIAGQVYMTGAQVPAGNVDFSGVGVDGSVWMETATDLGCHLTLERAQINKDLLLGAGHFRQLDLTGARIGREFRMENGGRETRWQRLDPVRCGDRPVPSPNDPPAPTAYSWMTLRNAQISAIRDTQRAWPECLTLTGLTYDRPPFDTSGHARAATDRPPVALACPYVPDGLAALPTGGLMCRDAMAAAEADESLEPRGIDWWCNWLQRDPQRTVQAYVQLASALNGVGDGADADRVRFAMREFERDRSHGTWTKQVADTLAMVFVGFGIGVYTLVALAWTAAIVLAAAMFLARRLARLRRDATVNADKLADKSFVWCLFASLQTILPLVTLSKEIDDFLHTPLVDGRPETRPLYGRTELWFAGVAVAGLVLSGFLLQGLRSYADL